jgi:hypothetical protein
VACLNVGTANNQKRIADKNPLAFSAVTATYIKKPSADMKQKKQLL